jgi:ubiquinone/menaquinone biosynthesis C-methylase UbiE
MINIQRWENIRGADRLPPDAPEHLIDELGVREHGSVAVIGARLDLFALPLASRVGTEGVVYALDSSDDVIPRFVHGDLPPQVRVRQTDRNRLALADQSVDLVLLAFVFRQIAHVATMLAEIRRVLRPGGRIAVADWIRQEENVGPVREERVSAATCERCLAAVGFGLIGQRVLNSSHYLIIGRRPIAD